MENINPKISVIVPVYKAEAYLHRCVDSLLAQTFQDYEILLVDDGSPDRSGEICDEYAKKDPRVRVFHNKNRGAGAARKFGVSKAIGEWIMFVDSDDTIPNNAIELLYELHDKADIVCGTINLSNKLIFKHQVEGLLSNSEYIEALLLGKTSIGPVAKLMKRTLFVLEAWIDDKNIRQNEDLLMLVTIAVHARSIYINPNIICYNYLQRENSASSFTPPIEMWLKLFSYIENNLNTIYSALPQALYIYELRRIYSFVLLKGLLQSLNNSCIEIILENCYNIKLSRMDRYKLYILSHKYLHTMDYYRAFCLHRLKYYLKKVFLICLKM